jgi:hypothetical protein
MSITIHDESVVALARALQGDTKTPNGTTLNFSKVGSTNTYRVSVPLNDGSGRNEIYWFDVPDTSDHLFCINHSNTHYSREY